MYAAVTGAMTLLSYIFEGYCAFFLFGRFLKERFPHSDIFVGIIWTVCGTVSSFFIRTETEMTLVIKLIIFIAVVTAASVILFSDVFPKRLFPAALFIAVRELSVQTANSLLALSEKCADMLVCLAEKNIIPYERLTLYVTICVWFFIILIEIVKTLLIYAVLRKIVKCCAYELETGREAASVFILCAAGIMISALLRLLLVTLDGEFPMLIYSKYPIMYLIVPALSVLLLFSVSKAFEEYQKTACLMTERAERILLEKQIDDMKYLVRENDRKNEESRHNLHDMKNDLAVLERLIADKRGDDDILSFFREMENRYLSAENEVNTGDAVTDAVIGNKFRFARKLIPDISLDAEDFSFGYSEAIKSYDMGVILYNALDNAIEASVRLREKFPEERAFITLRSYVRKNMFFIEAENAFDGIYKSDAEGNFLTLKEDGALHGIGLKNIGKCAAKYSGGSEYSVRGNVFTLTVMLSIDL